MTLLETASGDLIGAAVLLIIAGVKSLTRRIDASTPVKIVEQRRDQAESAERAVKEAIAANDVAWQKRWDEREDETAVLVGSFNGVVAANRANVEQHARALDELGRELSALRVRVNDLHGEAADWRMRAEKAELRTKDADFALTKLEKDFESERRMFRRTIDDLERRLYGMANRAVARGEPLTGTDILPTRDE